MTNIKQPHIALIDGYGFLFRAYYSIPPLKSPDGLIVGALFGYTSMIFKLRQAILADHMVIMLDAGKKTFRNDIYKDYKANRPPAPDDLIPQFPLIKDANNAMDIISLQKEGYEADDLIATTALKAKNSGFKVTIISSDKDLTQLIDEDIKIYDPMKQKMLDIDAVYEKYGVYPKQMQDYLSLVGDASDNIPGVPTIGPKTATELLNKFKSLQGVYDNIAEIDKIKRREKLIENKDKAFLSQKLVKLATQVDINLDLNKFFLKELDIEKLGLFFEKYGFDSLLSKINYNKKAQKSLAQFSLDIIKITNYEQLDLIIADLQIAELIFIEISTNKFFFATNKKIYWGDYVKKEVNSLLDSEQDILNLQNIYQAIAPLMTDDTIIKVFATFKDFYRKYLNDMLSDINKILCKDYNNIIDLEILNYLLDLQQEKLKINFDLLEKNEDIITNIQKILTIYYDNSNKLVELKQFDLFWNLDLPINNILLAMEQNGFRINQKKLSELTADFDIKIKKLAADIYKISQEEFNIASPKQLAEILFNKLAITSSKKSKKTKSLSTSQEVLEDLATQGHEIAGLILQWRHFAKLKNTYTEALPKLINPITNRVHSHFSNSNTATGRLSSNKPNLQNIPTRSKEGDLIRAAFICDPGNKLISIDYSQIELRLLAHIAKVKKLTTAFQNNQDIHAITASEVFSIPLAEIDNKYRRMAKAINFGIIYGLSAFGLAKRLQISNQEAKEYIELYFTRYPEIKQYMKNIVISCEKQGYVETLFGRKLFFPKLANVSGMNRGFVERAIINAPLQGSVADIVKKAMLDIDQLIKKDNLPMQLLLQVHDELIYEVPEDQADDAAKIIADMMSNVVKLDIALDVSVNIGKNWAELK